MFRRSMAVRLCLLLCAGVLPALLVGARAQSAPPLLITEEGTDNAVAVEPVTHARDPFPVTQALAFSADPRTRVMLFAQNVGLLPGETASALTATAEDAAHNVFPGLVRYDEVFGRREITHALRFTASRTRRAYVYPARHFASSNTDPNLPPMGMRVRLKASFDISSFSPAMHPPRAQEVRDDSGRQRQQLVRQRRPRLALERR